MSQEESDLSLEDGSSESSFWCLRRFFFFLRFFFFALESDKDVYFDEYDDEGFGSGFTSGSCISSCFSLSVDHVSGLFFELVPKSVCCVSGIFTVSCSKASLVSSSEFLI